MRLLSKVAQFMVKSKLFLFRFTVLAKYRVSVPLDITNICKYLYSEQSLLKLSLLYLCTWLKASRMFTPRFFSSTCTIGSPLTSMVTSYLLACVPVCSNWLITCNLFRAWLCLSISMMFCKCPSSKVKSHTQHPCIISVRSTMPSFSLFRNSSLKRFHSASVNTILLSACSCILALLSKASGELRLGKYS